MCTGSLQQRWPPYSTAVHVESLVKLKALLVKYYIYFTLDKQSFRNSSKDWKSRTPILPYFQVKIYRVRPTNFLHYQLCFNIELGSSEETKLMDNVRLYAMVVQPVTIIIYCALSDGTGLILYSKLCMQARHTGDT